MLLGRAKAPLRGLGVSLLCGIATQQYRALWRSQCVHKTLPLSANEATVLSGSHGPAWRGACSAEALRQRKLLQAP